MTTERMTCQLTVCANAGRISNSFTQIEIQIKAAFQQTNRCIAQKKVARGIHHQQSTQKNERKLGLKKFSRQVKSQSQQSFATYVGNTLIMSNSKR
jgi:dTDP-4-dehydrorhamnose 3,5-epimerase-like enzyme